MAQFRDIVIDAAVAGGIIGIVYFSGWAFLASYLGHFGIDPTQLAIPWTTVLVYAFRVLQSAWFIFALFVAVMVVGATIAWVRAYRVLEPSTCAPRWRKIVPLPSLLLGSVAVVTAALLIIHAVAASRAAALAREVWLGHRPSTAVEIIESPDESYPGLAEYRSCADAKRLRLIVGLPDAYFLICRSPIQPCRRAFVFAVSPEGRLIATTDWQRPENTGEEACEDTV